MEEDPLPDGVDMGGSIPHLRGEVKRTMKRAAILNMASPVTRTRLLALQACVIVKGSARISSTCADLQAMPGQDQPRKQHQVGNNAVRWAQGIPTCPGTRQGFPISEDEDVRI